jgi:hypothetical protein
MAKKANEIEVTVAEVVDYLRITGQFSSALNEVVERKVTAEAARKSGIKVTTTQLQKSADVFRAVNDLSKASDTNKWLRSTGISVEALEGYIETNILICKFKDALNKKASKAKYLSTPGIEESIREMIYQDWLKSQFK